MNCSYCGEHEVVCECFYDDDDGVEVNTDWEEHNRGRCKSIDCRFCAEDDEPEASVNYFMSLEMEENEQDGKR